MIGLYLGISGWRQPSGATCRGGGRPVGSLDVKSAGRVSRPIFWQKRRVCLWKTLTNARRQRTSVPRKRASAWKNFCGASRRGMRNDYETRVLARLWCARPRAKPALPVRLSAPFAQVRGPPSCWRRARQRSPVRPISCQKTPQRSVPPQIPHTTAERRPGLACHLTHNAERSGRFFQAVPLARNRWRRL
jgi:hypothetical protein